MLPPDSDHQPPHSPRGISSSSSCCHCCFHAATARTRSRAPAASIRPPRPAIRRGATPRRRRDSRCRQPPAPLVLVIHLRAAAAAAAGGTRTGRGGRGVPGLRRDGALRPLQRRGLRLQAALRGDGHQGAQGRQEHGHSIHRRAADQVDLLRQVLLHPLLHDLPRLRQNHHHTCHLASTQSLSRKFAATYMYNKLEHRRYKYIGETTILPLRL